MATTRIKIPKLESSTFKGWTFVAVIGALLAVLALFDRGGGTFASTRADGSTGCTLEVTTEELNVRAGPSQNAELLDALALGDRVDATPVVTDGFRQLEDGRWASNQYLAPVAGTSCS